MSERMVILAPSARERPRVVAAAQRGQLIHPHELKDALTVRGFALVREDAPSGARALYDGGGVRVGEVEPGDYVIPERDFDRMEWATA